MVAENTPPPKVLEPQVMPKPVPPELPPRHQGPTSDMPPQTVEAIERAFHCLLNKQTEEAIQILKPCFDPTRLDCVMQLLIASIGLNENKPNQLSPDEKNLLEQQLQSVMIALRNHGELAIDTMCLVESYDGYGQYKPVPAGHAFQPHEQVFIYVGLRNLAGALRGRDYETVLHGTVSIRDASGFEWYGNRGESDTFVKSVLAAFRLV